jgi:hypothetical protein
MGKWTEETFFKGRRPKGQVIHEEMLNIPGHKGNANQNYTKILLHSSQNDYDQEHKQPTKC